MIFFFVSLNQKERLEWEQVYLDCFATSDEKGFADGLEEVRHDCVILVFTQADAGSEAPDVVQRQRDVLLFDHFETWKYNKMNQSLS